MTAERMPMWPTRRYPERDDAIAAAMADAEDGEEVVVHQVTCAMRWDEPCDCTPEVRVVKVAQS